MTTICLAGSRSAMFKAEASITWSAHSSLGRRSRDDIKGAMKIEFAKEFQFSFFSPCLDFGKRCGKIQVALKVDDIKIKSKVGAFFLPLPVYLPFIALLSLFFCPFTGPKEGRKVQWNQGLCSSSLTPCSKIQTYIYIINNRGLEPRLFLSGMV